MDRYRMVIALDLSEYAEIVLEHGLDLAVRHSTPDLHFLTVVGGEHDVDHAKEELAKLVLEGLELFRDGKPDWHARLHVRTGRPEEEITDLAAEIDAHVIVVGRFLDTIAERVVERATCPTLVVGLVGRQVQTQPQCPNCMTVRSESDGERWFCEAHKGDRVTLSLPPSVWTGGSLMW